MLAQGLAILQGLQQLQTWQVGKQAYGYGAAGKWSTLNAGTPIFVNSSIGLSKVNGAFPQGSQVGSAQQPFASLGDALDALAAPATAAAWATPRYLFIAAGTYTFAGKVINRSLTLVCEPGTVISDQMLVNADPGAAVDHGSVADINVGVIVPGVVSTPGLAGILGAGIDVSGSAHLVNLSLGGVQAGTVDIEAATPCNVRMDNARANIVAAAAANDTHVFATNSRLDGPLTFGDGIIRESVISAAAILGDGVKETRLYGCQLAGGATWTGNTLLIDNSTNFDFVADGWVKANPGGVVPTIMT